ncbi:hypothetical protein CYMTET_53994 [Cymbomonas tetramitiformis]|uniref:Uncharacterized protein n=1 Tax=Cymbomonas tetramitiformis TaxID=36881 RepID=A0AAE0BHB4_9CHLO|nr:hypothetical protein CYMTET_53994 [Cymbomonas tetramitiformis]
MLAWRGEPPTVPYPLGIFVIVSRVSLPCPRRGNAVLTASYVCRLVGPSPPSPEPCDEANPTTSDSSPPTSTGGGTGRDSPPASPSPTCPEPCDEAGPTTSDSSPPTSAGGVDSDDPMEFHDEPQVAAHFPVDGRDMPAWQI